MSAAATATAGAGAGGGEARSPRYQMLLVALLSLNFGIVCFDRNALNYLMPFVKPELSLTNAKVGLLAGSLSLTWSVAAFGMGRLSDVLGNRKTLLVLSTLGFAACSFVSGLAGSFAILLLARLAMGIAEGGVMPLSHAMVAADVAPARLGLAQGIAQNVGSNLFGSVIAPIVLVAVAQAYGWRSSFFIAGAPGMLSAVLILLLLREPQHPPRAEAAAVPHGGLRLVDALRTRNILICATLSILLVSYLVICWAFMPLYLTEVRHLPRRTAGWLLGALGISATFGSFVVSGLSDRVGRRPILIGMSWLSIVIPLGAIALPGSVWLLGAVFFLFGWGINGIFPLFMATVPSESVAPRHAATVLGLCMGIGELLGGAIAPYAAGVAADATSLRAPLVMMTALAIVAGLVATGLRETAPARRSAG